MLSCIRNPTALCVSAVVVNGSHPNNQKPSDSVYVGEATMVECDTLSIRLAAVFYRVRRFEWQVCAKKKTGALQQSGHAPHPDSSGRGMGTIIGLGAWGETCVGLMGQSSQPPGHALQVHCSCGRKDEVERMVQCNGCAQCWHLSCARHISKVWCRPHEHMFASWNVYHFHPSAILCGAQACIETADNHRRTPPPPQNEQWREANRRRQRQTIRYRGLVPPPTPPNLSGNPEISFLVLFDCAIITEELPATI